MKISALRPKVLDKKSWPPNYTNVFIWRASVLKKLRADPVLVHGALAYYKDHFVEFICDWIDTYDPRLATGDTPTRLPLVLFEKQAELVEFLLQLMMVWVEAKRILC